MTKAETRAFRFSSSLAALLSTSFFASASPVPPQSSMHGEMVNQYCVSCHNNKLKTAGLTLEDRDFSKIADDAELWEKVLRKLDAREMPPAGRPRPQASDLKLFTAHLEQELDAAAAAHPNPGRPTIHRLNRNEYSNAVRDLLAVNFRAGDTLPSDDTGYGFDNIGDVLSLSPVLVERYLAAARQVTHLALGRRRWTSPSMMAPRLIVRIF